MAETPSQSGLEEPAGRPVGPSIDWSGALAQHQRWLRKVVFARVREPQAVDEIMQEVALAAVAQRAPLQDSARVGAWLYRLAVRHVLLFRRRHGRQRRLIGKYGGLLGGNERPVSDSDPLNWLLQGERQSMVREALALLSEGDMEILLLKYSEDWSYRELASHLGVSESAVEARLHRARKRLRDAMIRNRTIEESE
jgi:RNA polymerase sigma-70 factor (ECF subfamily)